jgi:hypothetical protein
MPDEVTGMEEMPELALIRRITHDELPECFELLNIDLTYNSIVPPNGAFEVIIRLRKRDEQAELPLGWGHKLTSRIRTRWGPQDLGISVQVVSQKAHIPTDLSL